METDHCELSRVKLSSIPYFDSLDKQKLSCLNLSMDTKKTNLTPELKEIYDRVMNTSSGKTAASAGTTPPLPTSAVVPPVAQPAIPTPPTPSPLLAPGTMPATLTLEMPATPNLGGSMMPPIGSPAEDALSSTPARPVSEGNTFSFSGTAQAPAPASIVPGATPANNPGTKKKAKISLPVLIVLGLVFLIVWGLFWAIIFGFIKR